MLNKTKQKASSIVLTGGGTGGHVIPHLALLDYLHQKTQDVYYLGSSGIEHTLMASRVKKFYLIPTGKLRRYFSFKNFTDVFKVFLGFVWAFFILLKLRPSLIFSKGGFVSVPVCWAGYLLRIPVITHEADITPGLATRLIAPIAKVVICAFDSTANFFPKGKALGLGLPIRKELVSGDQKIGFSITGFDPLDSRKIILIMGGSQGAHHINELIVQSHSLLAEHFRLIHLTGNGWTSPLAKGLKDYKAFNFVTDELRHLLAISDLVLSRAGANAIFEFLALQKPMLLIPLERGSRGDQVHNAEYFSLKGWASILREKTATTSTLAKALLNLAGTAEGIKEKQKGFSPDETNKRIASELFKYLH